MQAGGQIRQGVFTFTVESTSLQGGAILKVNGITLILNPNQPVRFDVYNIVSSKTTNGQVQIAFTRVNAVQAGKAAQRSKSVNQFDETLKINPVAVDMFNRATNNAYRDFNFKTKTKKDGYVVSAWKKIRTKASSKDEVDSYTFFRGIVMCIDKTGKVTCHYETN